MAGEMAKSAGFVDFGLVLADSLSIDTGSSMGRILQQCRVFERGVVVHDLGYDSMIPFSIRHPLYF